LALPFTAVWWDGMALCRMLIRAIHTQTLPRSPTRREFSIINIRFNTVERGCQAKVYKFNNRKDDASSVERHFSKVDEPAAIKDQLHP
jgi:hypothetical protein